MSLPTVEDYLDPAARLARSTERLNVLRRDIALMEADRDAWQADDRQTYGELVTEYGRVARERLALSRTALRPWPPQAI